MALGLAFYRALAWGSRPDPARFLRSGDRGLRDEAPLLDPAGWTGAFRYFDAQADDVLLTLAFLRDAAARGARLHSYIAVRKIARDSRGPASGFEGENRRTGEKVVIRARAVVSALGPWSNGLSELLQEELPPLVRPTRGSHFFLAPGVLTVRAAVVLMDRGGRRCYAIPWRGGTLLGTTDADDSVAPDAVAPTEGDRTVLLGAASRFFPSAHLTERDLGAGFSGLRPLVDHPPGEAPENASREERIMEVIPRLLASVGGKLTTARLTARHVVDRVERILARDFGIGPRGITAPEAPLPGGRIADLHRFRAEVRGEAFLRLRLSEAHADRILEREGSEALEAIQRMVKEPELARSISDSLPYTISDLVWGVERAFATTVDDLLSRRVRLSWESPIEAARLSGLAQDILVRHRAKPFPAPRV
jgi:glycerol-3-phosphate dehydrogenase